MNRRLFIVTLRDGLMLLQCAGLAVLRPLSSFAGEPRMDGSQTLKPFFAEDVMTGSDFGTAIDVDGDYLVAS